MCGAWVWLFAWWDSGLLSNGDHFTPCFYSPTNFDGKYGIVEESKEIESLKAASWAIHATKILKLTLIPWGEGLCRMWGNTQGGPNSLGFKVGQWMNVEKIWNWSYFVKEVGQWMNSRKLNLGDLNNERKWNYVEKTQPQLLEQP